MLPRVNRLSEKKDFQRVFLRGERAVTPFYTVRWHPNALSFPRFGFIVANKISKKAVMRNTIRRRLRECVRKNASLLTNPIDIVLTARPKALGAPSRALEPEVIRSLSYIQRRQAAVMRGKKQ